MRRRRRRREEERETVVGDGIGIEQHQQCAWLVWGEGQGTQITKPKNIQSISQLVAPIESGWS